MKTVVAAPESYLKLRNLMEDPSLNIDDFSAVVNADANLASAVLNIVNSAFFGIAGKIDSIPRAVNLLGIGQLYDMVLAVSAMDPLEIPGNFAHSSGLSLASTSIH
jgi:HD-like signal output (HDOD) protein